MNISDVQAVIDSAKVRDNGALLDFVRKMAPDATDQEVADTAALAAELVETVPLLLARATQAADERGLTIVVEPVLEHVARYFVDPIDLIPEMTQGMAGLLDDTYLALRLLDHMTSGEDPLFEADFDVPLRFLTKLVGIEISDNLDEASLLALEDVCEKMDRAWEDMGRAS